MSRDSRGQAGDEGHLSYCRGKMVGKAPPIAASRKDLPYHQLGCSFPYSHPPPPLHPYLMVIPLSLEVYWNSYFLLKTLCVEVEGWIAAFSRNATWRGFKRDAPLKSEIMQGWKVGGGHCDIITTGRISGILGSRPGSALISYVASQEFYLPGPQCPHLEMGMD